MIIHVDVDQGYGCKQCPYNVMPNMKVPQRQCKLTGTIMHIEEVYAIIRGATLINCPREKTITYREMTDHILERYT